MRITYIFHSGFVIENDEIAIIIDYFKDCDDYVKNLAKKTEKDLYILSSHGHGDHFNKDILGFNTNGKAKYIFSSDIYEEHLINQDNIVYIDKFEEYSDEKIYIKAFGSTDVGISFIIKFDKKVIFHAGDLNNWHWNEEVSLEEAKVFEDNYIKELLDIHKFYDVIDIAMFPLDPRLGADYMKGALQFIEKFKVKNFIPMHFGSNFQKANDFLNVAYKHGVNFIKINNKGDVFDESIMQI